VNGVQKCIRARCERNHSLVEIIYQGIQVQVAEKQCHVVKCASHRSLISVVQCDDSEVVNGHFHAMYAIKLSLVAVI
jgi:hypothetical protein